MGISETAFDDNGNVVYHKYSNGYEEFHEYDEEGNCVLTRGSCGTKINREFDEEGNCTFLIKSTGFWKKIFYDETGEVIRTEDSDGRIYDQTYEIKS